MTLETASRWLQPVIPNPPNDTTRFITESWVRRPGSMAAMGTRPKIGAATDGIDEAIC